VKRSRKPVIFGTAFVRAAGRLVIETFANMRPRLSACHPLGSYPLAPLPASSRAGLSGSTKVHPFHASGGPHLYFCIGGPAPDSQPTLGVDWLWPYCHIPPFRTKTRSKLPTSLNGIPSRPRLRDCTK